jgi:hypothetical protein
MGLSYVGKEFLARILYGRARHAAARQRGIESFA